MTIRLSPKHLLLTTGLTLMLGACSAGTPAASAAANGPATLANGAASAPVAAAGTTSPAGGGTADACSLLTKAEVETAFGETMTEPVASVDNGDPTCSYAHETGGLDLTVSISSRPSTAAAIKQAEAIYGASATDVSGVGDAAFKFSGILEFVKGTTLVTIGTGDGPAIISDAHFQSLTELAAGRV